MPVPFQLPRFYPILDTAALAAANCTVSTAARGLFDAGIRVLQYRHKGEWSASQFDEAKELVRDCQELGVLFVVNDRADVAKALRTALHVGQDDLPPAAARKVIGDEVMGLSTHNHEQLVHGSGESVEYLSFGPIFATSSKQKPDPQVGLEGLSLARTFTGKPLVAIGGITLENAADVIAAGADSLAVISGVLPARADRKGIRKRAGEWIEKLEKTAEKLSGNASSKVVDNRQA